MTIKKEAEVLAHNAKKATRLDGIEYSGESTEPVVDEMTGQPFDPPLIRGILRNATWFLVVGDPRYDTSRKGIEEGVPNNYRDALKEAWREGFAEKIEWMAAAYVLMNSEPRWADLPGRQFAELAVATRKEFKVSIEASASGETQQSSSTASGLKDDWAFRSAMEASHAANMSILKGTYIPPRPQY